MDALPRNLVEALADRYRVDSLIGAGGMGAVYRATDLRHGRRVALKVLRPDLASAIGADRFLREIQLVARLHHPHILALYDSGDADGHLYFVMPQVEGESLRQRLERERRLPVQEAVRILRDVVDGLGAAHRAGVVHRDIKPDNILLEGRHALLADFGLAKRMLATNSGALTSAGLAIGTPRYMAPEQAAGSTEADERTDLYALGVVAYEMLAGVPPVDGPTAEQIMARQVTATPVPLGEQVPETPAALADIVMRCLEKDPAKRPRSAEAVLGVLEGLATPSGGKTPTSARLRAVRLGSRWRWLLAAALGLVVAAAVVLAVAAYIEEATTSEIRMPTQVQLTFSGRVLAASPSPDGQMLAVLSTTDSGVQLSVKELSSDAETPLLHRSALDAVRWMPDGKYILTWANGAMSRVSRFGGEPEVLGPYGGVARDNVRFIKVSASGTALGYFDPRSGSACEVRILDPKRTVMKSYHEAMAGDRFAVVLASPEDDDAVIYLVSLDGMRCRAGSSDTVSNPVPMVEMPHIETVRWGPGDTSLHYLQYGGDALHFWRLRLGRRGNPGKPERMTGSIEAFSSRFEVISGTGAIVYVRSSSAANLHRLSFDRRRLVSRPMTTGTATNIFPRWDPSGRRIAFLRYSSGRSDLYVHDDRTGRETRVTDLDSVESGPAWSPDGRSLAAFVRRNGRRTLLTFVVGNPSTRQFHLGAIPGRFSQVVWVSESVLAFSTPDGRLATFNLTEGLGQPIRGDSTLSNSVDPQAAAPDGRQVLVRLYADSAGYLGSYLVDVASGTTRRVTGAEAIPLGFGAGEGDVVALHSVRRELISVSRDGEVTSLGAIPYQSSLEEWHTTVNRQGVVVASDLDRTGSDVWMLTDLDGPESRPPTGAETTRR